MRAFVWPREILSTHHDLAKNFHKKATMSRTWAILTVGNRMTDYISLGVIAKTFPKHQVEEVLRRTRWGSPGPSASDPVEEGKCYTIGAGAARGAPSGSRHSGRGGTVAGNGKQLHREPSIHLGSPRRTSGMTTPRSAWACPRAKRRMRRSTPPSATRTP